MISKAKSALFLWLDADLHRQLRVHCASQGTTASSIIRGLLTEFLASQPKQPRKVGVA